MTTASNPSPLSNPSPRLQALGELLGRILLAALFLLSGIGKLSAYGATAGYMAAVGVPAPLLPLAIVIEIGGALAIIAGWRTRIIALLLAGFTLVTAVIFHHDFADQMQMIMFLKNLSITGAFLFLAAHGAGRFSLDARRAG
ncbi:DoxX family protein [Achromobacter xylosoxidans]|uniref:DoxX family protein n=1 Tax=Alcaligenes xylosoxydans xylosoxydans TaxID=85698 RepID=UPI001F1363E1|nr:DoxX family protein [Achromobacter xylosoxidans]